MLIKSYPTRYPIWAYNISLWYASRLRISCGIYVYILQSYILRWLISGLIIMRLKAFWRLSTDDFQIRHLFGVWFIRYTIILIISGHISFGRLVWTWMYQALAIITSSECSAKLFCSGEYNIDILRLIFSYFVHALKLFLSADLLLIWNILIFLSN